MDGQRISGLLWALSLLGVGTFAGIAALPFAFAAEGGLPIQAIVWGTQIFINFLGVNVVMKKQGEFILNLFSSQSKREHRRLLAGFRHTVEEIVSRTLSSREGIPSALTPATTLRTGDKMLALLAAKADQYKISPYEEPSLLDGVIDGAASVLGATLVSVGLIGYVAAMEQHLGEKVSTDDKINLPLTLLFSSPFLDLVAYFAASTFINIARVMTCSNSSQHLAFRLYKAGAPAAMLSVAALSCFSFAGAVEVINKSPYFNGNGPFASVKGTYTKAAIVSCVISNNYAALMLVLDLIVRATRLGGSDIKKSQAMFSLAMEELLNDVEQKMAPHIFASSLQKLSPEQQRSLISFDNLNYNTNTMLDRQACGPTVESSRNQSQEAPGVFGGFFNWCTGRNRQVDEYRGLKSRRSVGGNAEELHAVAYGSTVITHDIPPQPSFWTKARTCLPSIPMPSCPPLLSFKCPDFGKFFSRPAGPRFSFSPTVVEDSREEQAINPSL